jgi:hypothetical protein
MYLNTGTTLGGIFIRKKQNNTCAEFHRYIDSQQFQ